LKLASSLLRLDAGTLKRQLEAGNLKEICHEAKSHTQ
jgi:hypothetical protein